jgi:hypothetical protein
MACGCSKKGMRNIIRTISPREGLRQVSGPRLSTGNETTPTALRLATLAVPQTTRSASGLNSERRKVERVRRDAIRRALNKN